MPVVAVRLDDMETATTAVPQFDLGPLPLAGMQRRHRDRAVARGEEIEEKRRVQSDWAELQELVAGFVHRLDEPGARDDEGRNAQDIGNRQGGGFRAFRRNGTHRLRRSLVLRAAGDEGGRSDRKPGDEERQGNDEAGHLGRDHHRRQDRRPCAQGQERAGQTPPMSAAWHWSTQRP